MDLTSRRKTCVLPKRLAPDAEAIRRADGATTERERVSDHVRLGLPIIDCLSFIKPQLLKEDLNFSYKLLLITFTNIK